MLILLAEAVPYRQDGHRQVLSCAVVRTIKMSWKSLNIDSDVTIW